MTRIEPGQEDQRGIQGILNGAGLGFRYSGLIDARFNFVSGFLHRLLCEVDLGYRTELVLTILRELATNCSKAHAKRIYFQSQGLDISIPADYASGMASFRADVLSHWDQFVAANSTNEFYIELSFELNADAIVIHMENNVELLPSEWERITQRRQKAAQIRDILEAFNAFDDDNEGAGLGIVFISLLLRNAGIAESNLIIDSRRGVTRHTLIVPRLPAQLRSGIRDEMLREIEGLPSLPDRVNQLVVLCSDSSASIASIAQEIERDPAMAAQIL
ncbi:MAG TPA: HDOD domain-containing protein, partial [Leptospiraceae bacterium]|nr:HDOD domain-containing protein [Leptospiraceae bacterium]